MPDGPLKHGSLGASQSHHLESAEFLKIVRRVVKDYQVSGCAIAVRGATGMHLHGRYGIEQKHVPWSSSGESLIRHPISTDLPVIMSDTLQNKLAADDILVTGPPFMRFFASAPLMMDGVAFGSLFIFDPIPRYLSFADTNMLVRAASDVSAAYSNLSRASTRSLATLTFGSLPSLDTSKDLDPMEAPDVTDSSDEELEPDDDEQDEEEEEEEVHSKPPQFDVPQDRGASSSKSTASHTSGVMFAENLDLDDHSMPNMPTASEVERHKEAPNLQVHGDSGGTAPLSTSRGTISEDGHGATHNASIIKASSAMQRGFLGLGGSQPQKFEGAYGGLEVEQHVVPMVRVSV